MITADVKDNQKSIVIDTVSTHDYSSKGHARKRHRITTMSGEFYYSWSPEFENARKGTIMNVIITGRKRWIKVVRETPDKFVTSINIPKYAGDLLARIKKREFADNRNPEGNQSAAVTEMILEWARSRGYTEDQDS